MKKFNTSFPSLLWIFLILLVSVAFIGCDSVDMATNDALTRSDKGSVVGESDGTGLGKSGGTGNVIVHPGNMHDWFIVSESTPGGVGELVPGPGTPPLGSGSAHFELTAINQGMTFQYFGTSPNLIAMPMSSVTKLEYCTYVSAAPGPQAVALQFNVDNDVTDTDTSWKGRLVFEPVNNGTVVLGTWQCWNTLEGNWWASGSPINGLAPQSNPQPLATILAAYPNMGFNSSFGGLILKAGSGWTSFDGAADNVTIGISGTDTVFDFEPVVGPPDDKNVCKNGGWQSFNNPSFKNQGDCIQFVNTGK